ncbi:MAG: hypothetical protein IKU83_06015, partial [Lachnospiraceae bacterium]|nr:hypothetical protein [Lachnospiraceae bacterium]
MKRRFCFILVVAIYMAIFSGCTNAADSKEDSDYRTIVDMAGREVIIPKKIERISCMTSAACETAVVAMGQASKLVCTTSYVDGNFEFTYKLFPELARVEKANAALSKEELINRKVDLVIIKNKRDIEKLTGTGIP